MPTNFPTALDSFTNPVGTDDVSVVPHAEQHANKNDAIEAIQAKLGINSSAVITTIDYLLKSALSSNPGHVHTASAISNFDEAVDDRVAALIQNGTGISWTYDDGAGTLTANVSVTQYTDELAQDAVGAILSDAGDIDFTYDDGTPSIVADIKAGVIVNADINASAAIAATKIADGSVSNAEFQRLAGVTSAIQTQLDARELLSNKSTDVSLGTSNTLYPTQNAVKAYVDAVAQGLSVKQSVQYATTAALPANTYNNGASGVGATLTGVATGVLTVDGGTIALNDRIAVKDEAAPANNGIYVCTVAGALGVAYVLTRSTNMDEAAEIPGAFTFVENGTVNDGAGFVVADAGPFTIGTTAINWTQFSGAGQITAGAGLTKSGNVIDAVGTSNRITVNADSIDIAATYVGQTSITTVGTIVTGTWSGLFGAVSGANLTNLNATNLITATESTDTTCFPVFVTASGSQTLPPKTNTNLTYNSNTGAFGIVGSLVIDNLLLDGNTLSSSSGAINLTPVAGSAVVLDTNVTVDGGVVNITGQLNIDNLRFDGNTASSTDTNGNFNIFPNGTGLTQIGADATNNVEVASTGVLTTNGTGAYRVRVNQLAFGAETAVLAGLGFFATPSRFPFTDTTGTEFATAYLASAFHCIYGFSMPETTVAQLTANTDNLNIGEAGLYLISSDASRNLTGIVAPSGPRGKLLIGINTGAQNIVYMNDATSTAANRFLNVTGGNITCAGGNMIIHVYQVGATRWRTALLN